MYQVIAGSTLICAWTGLFSVVQNRLVFCTRSFALDTIKHQTPQFQYSPGCLGYVWTQKTTCFELFLSPTKSHNINTFQPATTPKITGRLTYLQVATSRSPKGSNKINVLVQKLGGVIVTRWAPEQLPSGKLTWQWKVPFFSRKHIFIHGPFSIAIAMLVYWSV